MPEHPPKPKRELRPLTADQWRQARLTFESGDRGVTLPKVAAIFQTSLSSVQKRSANEKWSKGAQLIADARNELQRATTSALREAAQESAKHVTAKLMDELQPWLEAEKRAHIKRAIVRSKRAMKRLDRVAKGYQVYDAKRGEVVDMETGPKDEMNLAAAEDKYDGIIRRNLGMNEGTTVGGALNLNILTNQAAIQFAPGSSQP